MITSQVKSFIDNYKLLPPFVVAFSGGFDSMCLLDVLHKLGYETIAVHLNHNWRGNESDNEELNCKNFAKKRGITFYSEKLSKDVPKTETAARNARYEFFRRCAKKFNTNVVFTAHNYDDNAETVLYRIIKGTGTAGLMGIEPKREIFYRPLLSVSRKDIEKYCLVNGLKPNVDSSNFDTKYKRNLIRTKILPLMKEINPNVSDAINSLSEISREDFECKNQDKYFVRQILIDNNIDYDRDKIEYISDFIKENKNSKSGKTLSLSNELMLFVNNKACEVISGRINKSEEYIDIDTCGEYVFGDYIFSLKPFKSKDFEFPKDNEYRALVGLKEINFTLRYRHDGDIIYPLGANGSQKLKKYLNEKKVPQHKKDLIVLLCNRDNEVLWVSGYGISEKIKVTERPTHIIELKGREYEGNKRNLV